MAEGYMLASAFVRYRERLRGRTDLSCESFQRTALWTVGRGWPITIGRYAGLGQMPVSKLDRLGEYNGMISPRVWRAKVRRSMYDEWENEISLGARRPCMLRDTP
jgi:hypothetical protein